MVPSQGKLLLCRPPGCYRCMYVSLNRRKVSLFSCRPYSCSARFPITFSLKVAVMKSSGKFVVCDRGNERSRMQIFTKHGHFVRYLLSSTCCILLYFSPSRYLSSSADQIVMIVCEAPLFLRKIAIRYIDIVAGLAITR